MERLVRAAAYQALAAIEGATTVTVIVANYVKFLMTATPETTS